MLFDLVEMQSCVTACEGTLKSGDVVSFLNERMDGFDFFSRLIALFAEVIALGETCVTDGGLAASAFDWREGQVSAAIAGELLENGVLASVKTFQQWLVVLQSVLYIHK